MRTSQMLLLAAYAATLAAACQDPQPHQRRQAPPPAQAPEAITLAPASPASPASPSPQLLAAVHATDPPPALAGAPQGGVVQETMDAASYTYARLRTDDGALVWVAGPQTPLTVGARAEVSAGMLMRGFESKALGRRFDELWFVDRLSAVTPDASPPTTPLPANPTAPSPQDTPLSAQGPSGPAQVAPLGIAPLTPLEGGVTVAQILERPDAWTGKTVRLRAAVVRVNAGIMGRDWLHVQDGTRAPSGAFDLTITSAEGAPPTSAQPGDVITLQGVVSLNRDFGAGYRYDVLLEQATLEVERR